MKKDSAFLRAQRLSRISAHMFKVINTLGPISYDKLILWIQFEIGLSEKKAKEYVNLIMRKYESLEKRGNTIKLKEGNLGKKKTYTKRS